MKPPTSEVIQRWAKAMENEQYPMALSILDEGLQVAAKENNFDEITRCTNLKKYTHNFLRIRSENKEISVPTCLICGKVEADGVILIAGAGGAICEECVKICVRVVAEQRQAQGKGLECSLCGEEQSEVRRMIAGPGGFLCNECVERWAELLAESGRSQ